MTRAQIIQEWIDLYIIGLLALFAHVASKAGWWLITRSKRADRLARRIERKLVSEGAITMEVTR